MPKNALGTEPRIVVQATQWERVRRIEEMDPISDTDYAVLSEVRKVLLRHGYEDRFGVCLIHKHFDIGSGEALLEESDEKSRISTIRIVPKESCANATETAWRFTRDGGITAGRECEMKCRGFGMTGHQRWHKCKPT